jgi:hypothetical protein
MITVIARWLNFQRVAFTMAATSPFAAAMFRQPPATKFLRAKGYQAGFSGV